MIDVEAMGPQQRRRRLRMLAIGPQQQALLAQVRERNRGCARQPVLDIDQQDEVLGEQRPAVEAIPGVAQLRGDAELGFAVFQKRDDLGGRPAQQPAFSTGRSGATLRSNAV